MKRLPKRLKVFVIILIILAASVMFVLNYATAVTKNLDTYEYELPYKRGERYKVVQGYGGLFTHQYTAALDIEMPVGTPVCAAREGIVYSWKDNNDEGGIGSDYKQKANYIIIKHDDGSFGCYWHLQKNGVLVKSGRVASGQQIGLSGATGQVLRPHLHFSVKNTLNYEMNSFVRTKFKTSEGVLLLKKGNSYKRKDEF